ncbi:MAG: dihydrolipoamide acetyltransferase family protein, partial [Bdellovibrio sp.]
IETPKAAVEVDSFRSGKIVEIVAKPDDVYPVGAVLAKMELDFVEEESVIPPVTPPEHKPEQRQRISPAARKLAEQSGIALDTIQGSGINGAIEIEDVRKKMASAASSEPVAHMLSIRDVIAQTMARSKKEIPHYYLKTKVVVDNLIESIDKINSKRSAEDRILMPAALMYILTQALKKYPEMNGYFENNKFIAHSEINMGMAISIKTGGVTAPAVLDMQNKDLPSVNSALKDLVQRTREGKLKANELSQGTITVTNLGDFGCEQVFGVIFPPQVALVGFGQIRKEAIVEKNILKPGYVIDVTLSADHRVTDGLYGAKFLQTISEYLARPVFDGLRE